MPDVLDRAEVEQTIIEAANAPTVVEEDNASLESQYDFGEEPIDLPSVDDSATSEDDAVVEEESTGDNSYDGDADEVSEEVSEEVQTESQEDDWDDGLLARATEAGLSDEEAMAFGGNEGLETALNFLAERSATPEQEVEATAEVKAEVSEPEADLGDLAEFELDADMFDEATVEKFKGLGKYTRGLEAKLNMQSQELSDMRDVVGRLNEADIERGLDSSIATMVTDNAGLKDVLGEGSLRAVTPEQKANRLKVLDMAATMQAGLLARGKQGLGDDVLMKRAMHSVYGSELTKIAREGLKAQAKSRRTGSGSRPSKRKMAVTQSRGSEAAALRASMQGMGLHVDDPPEGFDDDDSDSIY